MQRAAVVSSIVLTSLASTFGPLCGDDWPGWRGPGTRNVSAESGLPVEWSGEKNLLWSVDLPGWGNSSPVIVGERIYLTAQTDNQGLHVFALDRRKGEVLWRKQAATGLLKHHELHNMATPTPAAEPSRVWALFGTGDLVALDERGEVLWKRNLAREHGEYKILWGMGSSPVLFRDRLFVACMHQGPSYVLAVDKASGKDLWKTPRDLECKGEAVDSYSSPALLDVEGRTQVVVSGADHVTSYDPLTGKQLWISSGLSIPHDYGRTIASPGVGGSAVYAASSGFGGLGRVLAVRAGGQGDVSATHRLWAYEEQSPDCPTPLHYQGLVYVVRDNGVVSCLDAVTGKLEWRERVFKGDVKASPVAGDGKVYCLGIDGECVVLSAGRKFEKLATNALPGKFIASPAISGGVIYLRSREKLFAMAERR
jgi:hypothetical protein